MSWMIYTLLGVGIIILLVWTFHLTRPYRVPLKEGAIDYFNIESYLQTLQTTRGRFVRVFPAPSRGDGYMTFSQIQVFDMNGNNLAEKKTVFATSTSSGVASSAVDGNENPKSGTTNTWSSGSTDRTNTYWEVDLGSTQQLAQIVCIGKADASPGERDRMNGMIVRILDENRNVVLTRNFTSSDMTQMITLPNSINLTPSPSSTTVSPLNPLIMPVNSPQPEVFLLGPVTTSRIGAEVMCNTLGATLATSGQVSEAQRNGAEWCSGAWVKDSQNMLFYPSRGGCSGASNGINSFSAVKPDGTMLAAQANCFGVKPAQGVNTNVSAFKGTTWTQYVGNSTPTYYGNNTISVPSVENLYNQVIPKWGTGTAYGSPPKAWVDSWKDLSGNGLYSSLIGSSPMNFLYDEGSVAVSTITAQNVSIQVFGSVSAAAIADMNASMDLCRRIYLGSPDDVDKFINIQYNDLQPYMRANNGYANYCRCEIVQMLKNSSYQTALSTENQTANTTRCAQRITRDMLGLLPHPARRFVINWIYQRTARIMTNKFGPGVYDSPAAATAASAALKIQLNSLEYMIPTAGGAPVPFDPSNKYYLDQLAQSFYEAMGGNYIMSNIYDVFTIGRTVLDVRFDMTKHADVSALQTKIATLKATYNTVRTSNVSQDILDTAKENYDNAVADIQDQQNNNLYPPILGMVGRFFYTFNVTTSDFQITGFTLDARAVTSFIPELNCGIQTATGGDPGTLSYEPKIVYTMNMSEPLQCTDPTTLRRIMEDYVDAAQADLADTLLNATPSVDTTQGVLQVNEILGAVQISKRQCAIKWRETLWSDLSNSPVSAATTNITRRGIFTYDVNQTDWYATDINMDASGFILYQTDQIPQCRFDQTKYQNMVTPRLDNSSTAAIQSDFINNTFNNGRGNPCPHTIPEYRFSAADYVAANSDIASTFNSGGVLNEAGAANHYATSGLAAGRPVRAAQNIPALSPTVVIRTPLPENNTLDNANGACPATTCEDLNVLYALADGYNTDPTVPGSIMRITRAYTANENQCDVEAEINFDATVEDTTGKIVKKGSFTVSESGAQTAVTTALPSGIKKDTLSLMTDIDSATCKMVFNGSDGPGTGTSILPNTPALYKPMEYATEFQKKNGSSISSSFDKVASVVADAAASATSILSTYRTQTVAAVGNIATLGTCPTAKCSDTVNLNAMLAYYKTQNIGRKQINTVLRVGTLDEKTCDLTFQEDTLTSNNVIRSGVKYNKDANLGITLNWAAKTANVITNFGYNPSNVAITAISGTSFALTWPSQNWGTTTFVLQANGTLFENGNTWTPATPATITTTIASSQTAAMRFTMAPGATACAFTVTGMTPVLPAPPPSTANDMANKPNSATCSEVYYISGNFTQSTAAAKCASYGGVLATHKQLQASQAAGADWCSTGYVADMSGTAYFPTQTARAGCGTPGVNVSTPATGIGANCFGVKPRSGQYTDVLPFAGSTWNQPNTCGTFTNYVNPNKEAFTDYGPPIQVAESTYPLNTTAFGLARNRSGPRIDELYKEPLRQDIVREPGSGPQALDSDDSLRGKRASSYKYIRFRPTKTRYPMNPTVDVAKFRFFLGKNEVDVTNAKVTNPMGSWVGDVEDVVGAGFTRGWSDVNKKALVFAFPYAILLDGFTWTTANPDKGLGGDPVQWKLEGSQNGVYWTVLRDQTRHDYPVPKNRFQELTVFKF